MRICYEKSVEMNSIVSGPKKLAYDSEQVTLIVFIRFGVIRQGMGQNRQRLSSSKRKIPLGVVSKLKSRPRGSVGLLYLHPAGIHLKQKMQMLHDVKRLFGNGITVCLMK